ncbi:hypothetical protein CVT24_005726 [Panaeolus cyanescens]|uniref:Uncharacterized protein n=1 Tax=Panaeolus cyanescens TaxID=181874 RepID=A0A409V949_9AGAR|nr:hypothetical protein CVT24_005726 [Panaeolus cyanescens]
MDSREDFSRVSIGSVQQWHTLKSNFREAALQQLESSGLSAKDKAAVQEHLEQFVERTFSLAQTNLRINGQNFESLVHDGKEMEPFDEALDRQIWSLADTRLQWHKRIAETRRTVPIEIQSNVSALLDQHRTLDIAELSVEPELDEESSAEEGKSLEEVATRLIALSNELEQTVSKQSERAVELKTTALEIKNLRP